MIDFRAFRAVAIAGAMAACAAALTSAPAQAQDGSGPWSEIRDARQDYRADTRDLRREFRVERREDRIDWHQGDYDSAGEFVRESVGGLCLQPHFCQRPLNPLLALADRFGSAAQSFGRVGESPRGLALSSAIRECRAPSS